MVTINPIKKIKYYIDDIDIIVPGKEPIKIPLDNISAISIDKSYDRFFPILNIITMVDYDTYSLIINNYNKILFNINMYVSETMDDNINAEKPAYAYKRAVIRSQFRPTLEDVNPILSENMLKSILPEDTNVRKDQNNIPLNLYLFNEEHLRKYRKLLNTVLIDTNMNTVLYYVLNYFQMKNVLLSKPDNTTTYEQIIVPPYNFLATIDYLQKVYGIYNTGYVIFQDYDVLYLISKKAECNAYRPNEYKRIHFNVVDVSSPDAVLSYGYSENKDSGTCIINVPTAISMKNKSINEKDKKFNEMIIVNSKNGNITTKDINLKGYGDYKTPKIFHNNYSNPYIENSIKNEMEEGNNVFAFTIEDIDMSLLSVNKEYLINFENMAINTAYGGKCRLARTITVFTKNMDHFTAKTLIELRKV